MARPSRYRYKAEILDIKRADKFKVRADLGFNTYKVLDLKLAGVNCKDGDTKALEFVREKVAGKQIDIHTLRDIKGVWLCSLWVEGYHLNSNLLKSGYGTEFQI
jgi:hypothetical protein